MDSNNLGACSYSSQPLDIEHDGAFFDCWDIHCPLAIVADDEATVDSYEVRFLYFAGFDMDDNWLWTGLNITNEISSVKKEWVVPDHFCVFCAAAADIVTNTSQGLLLVFM